MSKAAKVGLLLAALAGAAPAARADWIVTHDGGRFEIKGSWQVKGKMVVFSLPNGTLSSLRGDKVDVEASRRATEQAKKEAAEGGTAAAADKQRETAARPKKPSVRVLTDKDFKKGPESAPPSGDGKDGKEQDKAKAEAAKDTVPAAPGTLQIVGWNRVNPGNFAATPGVQLNGTVRNAGADLLTELAVTAIFYDESGALIARVPAVVAAQRLGAGETAAFSVNAPNVSGFAAVKFEPQGRGFKVRKPAPPKGTGGAAAPPNGETAQPASPPPPGPG